MPHPTLKNALSMLLISTSVYAAPKNPDWQIVKTNYPTTDILVAGFNGLDFGAQGDGKKDSTTAFQSALNAMKDAGGGTVFVPEGKYAFNLSFNQPGNYLSAAEGTEAQIIGFVTRGDLMIKDNANNVKTVGNISRSPNRR
jgi:hypothetical protein